MRVLNGAKVWILVVVSVLISGLCAKNVKDKKQWCKSCVEAKNTTCIALTCDYRNNTTIPSVQQDNDYLAPPVLHCRDEGLLVLTWEIEAETSYFVEYTVTQDNRQFTNLTTNNYEVIKDLTSSTNYFIQLTSIQMTDFNLNLRRSPSILLRTLTEGRAPMPVSSIYLDSLFFIKKDITYTALIKWDQGPDKSCFYNLVWFGSETFGDYREKYIENPFTLFQMNMTDLNFGQNYSLSIKAVRLSTRTESSERWLSFEVPTCLETFQNLINCTPEIPANLEVQEFIRSRSHVGFPRYDVKISWSAPNYTPDYYIASLRNRLSDEGIKINITGDATSAQYTDIELDTFYAVYLEAYSVKGASEPANIYRLVNSTAALLTSESWTTTEIILITVIPIVVIGLVLLLVVNQFLIKKDRANYFKELEKKSLPTVNYIVTTQTNMSDESDEWELIPEKLSVDEVLGEGAFGVVRKGYYEKEGGGTTEVAIKMLKDNPTQDELKQFYQEIDIMKSVPAHPHLVSLIGCITRGTSKGPFLVVEYCSKGDLQTYLRNAWNKLTNTLNRDKIDLPNTFGPTKCASNKLYDLNVEQFEDIPQPKDLISYTRQIALGMEYLSSLKLIHRDLAARNVLICKDNTVKVSDFGLSRDVYHDKVYCKTTGGKLPLRWMALESMTHQVYTTQSDVWSFGILLWEIVTLGSTPYPGVSTGDLLPLLKSGYRMEKPSNCSDELYTVMCKCWKAAPRERPTFCELRKTLDDLLESVSNYLNLNARESPDISITRKNDINKYKNVNFSEGYIIQM